MNIAFGDYDLSYTDEEAELIITLWNEGTSLPEIAAEVRPTKWGLRDTEQGQWEVYIILGDLARLGRLEQREGGLLGGLGS